MSIKGTHSYLYDERNENINIYINGKIYDRNNASISVFDSGFLLGDGVWEGIRLLNGHLVFLDEHIKRLFHGAKKLAINIGKSPEELIEIINYTINSNNMHSGVHIRVIISRGKKITPYQHPNANVGDSSIVIIPEYKEANDIVNKRGIKLVEVSIRRGNQNTQDPRLNTLSKLNCIMACIEADRLGADEGIMLDINGNVATCNSTNFFIIRNDEIWTSKGNYCLPGITRKAVIDICNENKLSIFNKDFRMDKVYSADEAFVTGTFAGIIPVIEVDGKIISNGKPGNITEKLQKLYQSKLNQLYPFLD